MRRMLRLWRNSHLMETITPVIYTCFIYPLDLFTQSCWERFFSHLVSSAIWASLDSAAILCVSEKEKKYVIYHVHIVQESYI